MADASTTYAQLSADAFSYVIAEKMYTLAERHLLLSQYAEPYPLAEQMGKTLRIARYKRFRNPTSTLTEGTPPDAVALEVETVDVTVEQWGLVGLLTDVANMTIKHRPLGIMIDRVSRAVAETQEREMATVLLGGTTVYYATGVASRAALDGTKKWGTSDILKLTTTLRSRGAVDWDGGRYVGVVPPQLESEMMGDTTFANAATYSQVMRLNEAEIGTYGGTRFSRGNFLPIFKGVGAPGTQDTEITGYGNETGAGALLGGSKITVIAKDVQSGYERKISQEKTVGAGKDTADLTTPTSTNYVYDIYLTSTAGTSYKRVFTEVAANTVKTLTATIYTNGSAKTPTSAPASGKEVFVAWIFGREAYARVPLNALAMEATVTPDQASYSNPLRQGRKVGSKYMQKDLLLDNNFFGRIESNSTYPAELPA